MTSYTVKDYGHLKCELRLYCLALCGTATLNKAIRTCQNWDCPYDDCLPLRLLNRLERQDGSEVIRNG